MYNTQVQRSILTLLIVSNLFPCLMSMLTAESMVEPGCLTPEPAKDMTFSWLLKLASGTTFYMPMGSKYSYYLWAELLKGASLESEDDLSTMCPAMNVQMTHAKLTAYGNTLRQNCSLVKVGVASCILDSSASQPATYSKADSVKTFTWTDNKDYMLVIGCVGGKSRSWVLYSKEAKVEESARKTVLETVVRMGFDDTKIFNYFYDKCKL